MSLAARKKHDILSDLLPYLQFDESSKTLWLRDGRGTRTLRLVPKNVLSWTEDDLETLRTGLGSIVNQLPEGSIAQIYFVRELSTANTDSAFRNWKENHTSKDSEFDLHNPRHLLYEAKSKSISSQWDAKSLYQTKIYITLSITPDVKANMFGKFGPLAFLAFNKGKKKSLKNDSVISHELDEAYQTLKTGLESQGFETAEPDFQELAKFIYKFLNPERSSIKSPENLTTAGCHDLSEAMALTDLIESKNGLALGRTRIQVGSIKTFPEASYPGLMTRIAGECQSFILVMTFIALSQTKERERLSRRQRLATGMAGGNHIRNIAAESQLQSIEDTLGAMISSGEKLFVTSLHLITFTDQDTDHQFRQLLDSLERIGNGSRWFEETVGAYPVFFGILPFAPTFITRPQRLLTTPLTDFLPLYGIGEGHKEASVLFESPYQSLLGFSLYENSPSANAILVGSAGSGKSMLACGIINSMTAGDNPNAPSTFVVDVGNSFKRTILFHGGSSLDLSPESGSRLNPFDLEPGQKRPDPEKVKFLTAIFDEILGDNGNLSKLERALLEIEILEFYEKEKKPTLSKFRDHLERSDSIELKHLSKLLTLWCNPHPYGLLFDGETNVSINSPHLHFELKGCQRYPDLLRVAMLVVMDLIWREVKKRFPKRSLVAVDECHTIVRPSGDGRSNAGARWVDDSFRQMRKFSSGALALSQTAKDLKNDEIADGILANAPNRFILRQRGDEKTLREDLKLSEQELKEVFSLSQVRGSFSEFYLHSETIKGTLIYRPTSLELWLATTHPPDIELLQQEQKAHPEFSLKELMQYMAKNFPNGAEERSVS